MHQLTVITVKEAPFQSHKSAIGQIAFNDDLSAPVIAAVSGSRPQAAGQGRRCGQGGRSAGGNRQPEILQPQNDFIAAVTSLNKAKAQLNLAQTIESRQRLLFDGKATPLKELQLADAQLAVAENDLRSAETALDAARSKLRIIRKIRGRDCRVAEEWYRHPDVDHHRAGFWDDHCAQGRPRPVRRAPTRPDPLFLIADLSPMWLEGLRVPENDAPSHSCRPGGRGQGNGAAGPPVHGARHRGWRLVRSGHPSRRWYVPRVANPEGVLKADMFASFPDQHRPADRVDPSVPVESVIRARRRSGRLGRAGATSCSSARLVSIGGLSAMDSIQINAGLNAGERILSRGAIFVDNEWRQ